jgi:hypothetical protein
MIKNYQVKSTIFEINKTKGTKIGAIVMENKRKRVNNILLKNSLKINTPDNNSEAIPKVVEDSNNYKGNFKEKKKIKNFKIIFLR